MGYDAITHSPSTSSSLPQPMEPFEEDHRDLDTRPEGNLTDVPRGRESAESLISVETTFLYLFLIDICRIYEYIIVGIKRIPQSIADLFRRIFGRN